MPTASSGPTEMGVRDMFDLPMHSWWRRTKTGATFPRALANRPLVSRPRGRLNGARIHTLEFSKISEDPDNSEVVADA
jgi:hypothetical protein